MLTTEIDYSTELYEPDRLLECMHDFIHAYQETGASSHAWMVYESADRLWCHPDYEGSDEERCLFRKLAGQWKMLALAAGYRVGRAA